MDGQTLGAALALVKKMPETAVARAEAAAEAAEASAELAQEHSYGVSVDGTKLVFSGGESA